MAGATIEKGYLDNRFGQGHFYRARPRQRSDRPPLLCFHMSPWSAAEFESLLKQMGQDRLTIAIDTPGYGNSDAPSAPPTMEEYAGAMADVLDQLGLDEFDVLGNRTGAKVALALAQLRPQRVRRAILISPVVWTEAERAGRRVFPPEVVAEDGSHVTALWRLSMGLSMPGRSIDGFAEKFYTRLLHHRTLHWARRAAANYDARAGIANFPNPIMVLRPKDDLWPFPPRVVPLLQHPQSHLRDLPDWGYGFMDVKPAETAAIVRSFLDS